MPKAMEKALMKSAAKKGLKGARKDAYVFGAMRKAGWKPKKQKKTAYASLKSIMLKAGRG